MKTCVSLLVALTLLAGSQPAAQQKNRNDTISARVMLSRMNQISDSRRAAPLQKLPEQKTASDTAEQNVRCYAKFAMVFHWRRRGQMRR